MARGLDDSGLAARTAPSADAAEVVLRVDDQGAVEAQGGTVAILDAPGGGARLRASVPRRRR